MQAVRAPDIAAQESRPRRRVRAGLGLEHPLLEPAPYAMAVPIQPERLP